MIDFIINRESNLYEIYHYLIYFLFTKLVYYKFA